MNESPNNQDQSSDAATCQSKRRYDTPEAARAAAVYADWQHGADTRKLQVYHCRQCGDYHLASNYDE